MDELKAYQQQGNLDPYGFHAGKSRISPERQSGDVPDDQIYRPAGKLIPGKAHQTAPENCGKKLITPGFSTSDDSGSLQSDFQLFRLAETDDGSYYYRLTRDTAGDATKKFLGQPNRRRKPDLLLECTRYLSDSPEVPSAEKSKEMAGIPSDEATAITDALMKKSIFHQKCRLAVGSQVDTSRQ